MSGDTSTEVVERVMLIPSQGETVAATRYDPVGYDETWRWTRENTPTR